jgi:hypothetical protein
MVLHEVRCAGVHANVDADQITREIPAVDLGVAEYPGG